MGREEESRICLLSDMRPQVTKTFQLIADETGGDYEGISAEAMLKSAIRRRLAREPGVSYIKPAS